MSTIAYDVQDEQTKQKKGELKNEKPIEVLFEGTDTNIFKKVTTYSDELVEQMKVVEESFNFLYVGHWLQGGMGKDRKDTGMLVKVFLETFKNKAQQPALLMKTSGATFSVIDREDILQKIRIIYRQKCSNIFWKTLPSKTSVLTENRVEVTGPNRLGLLGGNNIAN